MDVMLKLNRALKNSKMSVVRLDQEQIVERSFIFFHDSKRIPLTIKLKVQEDKSNVELILWETDSRVAGQAFPLEQAHEFIPGFNSQNHLFCSHLQQMLRKTKRPTAEQRKHMALRYSDYDDE